MDKEAFQEQKTETRQKIEAQVLLHKLQEAAYDIARKGRGELLKPFQDMGLLDENFKLSKNFTMENYSSGKPILDPRPTPKMEGDSDGSA